MGNDGAKLDTTDIAATVDGHRPDGAESRLPRGSSLGRFLVLDCLGVGGMGQVYSAYDPELNRKVALKLLRSRSGGWGNVADDQTRLLREAQAMARLSHPNVVTVFDVGAFQEGIFIAMELVEGKALSDWLNESARGWSKVLEMFIQAGRGLAAAHAAGIVHRDFKPLNVLVGIDGRARVTDFGLARAREALPPGELRDVQARAVDSISGPLTVAGALLGTPAYMSPEQIRGGEVDARSDQFSFCVALYQALFGERPFAGATLEELQANVTKGEVRPLPRRSTVPRWLRRVILRGLAANPADRFSGMEELLDVLSRRRATSRFGVWAAAAVAVQVAGVVGYRIASPRPSNPCAGVARRLDGIWDADTQESIRHVFDASDRAYARDAWAGARRTLDLWAHTWTSVATSACEAERRGGSDAEQRQRDCLEDRRLELASLVRLLRSADAKLVSTAVEATSALPAVNACADIRRLRTAELPSGISPEASASIRLQLAEAKALRIASRFVPASKAAASVVDSARKLGGRPLLAESLLELGKSQAALGESKAAVQTLEEADAEADASGLDWMRAETALKLAYSHYLRVDLPAGHWWARRAESVVTRLGGDDSLGAELQAVEGSLAIEDGNLTEALRLMTRSVAMFRAAYSGDHNRIVGALRNLSSVQRDLGRCEDALATAQEAAAMSTRLFGADHPRTHQVEGNVAEARLCLGDYDQALLLARKRLEATEPEYGPKNYSVGESAAQVGQSLLENGETQAALEEFLRTEDIYRDAWGAQNYVNGYVFTFKAEAFRAMGKRAEAWAAARRAADLFEKGTPRRDAAALALSVLGDLSLDEGKNEDARAFFHRALVGQEAVLGPDSPLLAVALTGEGEAAVAAGALEQGLGSLKRAMKLREGRATPRAEGARTRFALARAMWQQGEERGKALELADEAVQGYASGAKREQGKASAVAAWASSRRASLSR